MKSNHVNTIFYLILLYKIYSTFINTISVNSFSWNLISSIQITWSWQYKLLLDNVFRACVLKLQYWYRIFWQLIVKLSTQSTNTVVRLFEPIPWPLHILDILPHPLRLVDSMYKDTAPIAERPAVSTSRTRTRTSLEKSQTSREKTQTAQIPTSQSPRCAQLKCRSNLNQPNYKRPRRNCWLSFAIHLSRISTSSRHRRRLASANSRPL